MTETALVWFRRDLRVRDNPTLAAAADADRLIPVYCFDPREYGLREYGGERSFRFRKTGSHRVRFRRESVADLRESLSARGSGLVVRRGRPEEVLPELAAAVDADRVFAQTLPAPEEVAVENRATAALRDRGLAVHRFWTHTLYHVADLPTPFTAVDDTYTPFRKAVEAEASVRDPVGVPDLPSPPASVGSGRVPAGEIPSPVDLDEALSDPTPDERAVHSFPGGEGAGRDRLKQYLWRGDHLREYKETRNGMLGADYSSKLSPWLNEGCLSPRAVEREVRRYEDERVANESTYWLLFELLWRDFFQFQSRKHGGAFFRREGIRERTDLAWRGDGERLRRWKAGETGVPFVDANVRELVETGYVSNRGRQNAASFLANDLGVDWRRGAAFFETHLVDYDPCSNYGNWAYVAGVGNDSRDRSFDVLGQARTYDPDAEYVKTWLPELDALSPERAHEPWTMSEAEQEASGVRLGVDYPEPVVRPDG
ncbi:DASH family cryptochrome [Halogeometricum luteum]|uniref:Cryptochrome DASH n=1 Tax=Halogeometricum luteum TaxID=2950537 RepID=A0ABU2G1X4_9EURY|nr:DASH family cryptochrome [Halogeometricum sp. S3BR5-2]MDS0294790.1 DASH family cryptochrome [Halogeometricum sp. S3BR5-2]